MWCGARRRACVLLFRATPLQCSPTTLGERGLQRGLWPADNESRGKHSCTATATLEPQVTNHLKKKTRDAKRQSGVQWPPTPPVGSKRGVPWELTPL